MNHASPFHFALCFSRVWTSVGAHSKLMYLLQKEFRSTFGSSCPVKRITKAPMRERKLCTIERPWKATERAFFSSAAFRSSQRQGLLQYSAVTSTRLVVSNSKTCLLYLYFWADPHGSEVLSFASQALLRRLLEGRESLCGRSPFLRLNQTSSRCSLISNHWVTSLQLGSVSLLLMQ